MDNDPSSAITMSMEPVTAGLLIPRFGGDSSGDLGDEDWPTQTTKHGVRLRTSTAVLLAILLAAAGLWGGIFLQKHEGSSSSASAFSLGARGGLAGAGAARSSTASATGSSVTSTTGTVTDIIGSTLYVTNSSGSLVKVTLSSSAKVTRNASSSLSALKPGDTVTVQGTKPTNGAMTASSVSATEKGVTSTSGFGGFGGGGTRPGAAAGG
jgi:preprotein translocase subunit SecG